MVSGKLVAVDFAFATSDRWLCGIDVSRLYRASHHDELRGRNQEEGPGGPEHDIPHCRKCMAVNCNVRWLLEDD